MRTKSFKPHINSVHEIQGFVNETILSSHISNNKLLKIELAIEEIIVNIVRYGCHGNEDCIIEVGVDLTEDKFILEISDNGSAFNPLEQEPPDIKISLDQRKPGGLGIFIVKQIAKELKYEHKNNKNILRLCLER